jgi:hypothetical protein
VAIKFDYHIRCLKCGFEDDDDSPRSVIWKVFLEFENFRSKSYDYFRDTLSYYFVSPRDICPSCKDSKFQFSISAYEYFRNGEDYRPKQVGNGILVRRLDSDFSECFIINKFLYKNLINNKTIKLKFNQHKELTLSINEGSMAGTWYYALPSYSKCYDENSESFQCEYVNFTNSNQSTYLFIEEKIFSDLLNLSHQEEAIEFSKEKLSEIPFIERYFPIDD